MTKIIYRKITITLEKQRYLLQQKDSSLFVPKSKLLIYDFVDCLNQIEPENFWVRNFQQIQYILFISVFVLFMGFIWSNTPIIIISSNLLLAGLFFYMKGKQIHDARTFQIRSTICKFKQVLYKYYTVMTGSQLSNRFINRFGENDYQCIILVPKVSIKLKNRKPEILKAWKNVCQNKKPEKSTINMDQNDKQQQKNQKSISRRFLETNFFQKSSSKDKQPLLQQLILSKF